LSPAVLPRALACIRLGVSMRPLWGFSSVLRLVSKRQTLVRRYGLFLLRTPPTPGRVL